MSSFVRIGKSGDDMYEPLDAEKRLSSFVRIGKSHPPVEYGNIQDNYGFENDRSNDNSENISSNIDEPENPNLNQDLNTFAKSIDKTRSMEESR